MFYLKFIYVTRVVHRLHFLKAPSRIEIFKNTAINLSLPPEPIKI